MQVIINADDFGYNSSVNLAIAECFKRGLINSSSLMANMPGFEEATELVFSLRLENKIGVHLVLTEGNSLTEDLIGLDHHFNRKTISQQYIKRNLFLLDRQKQRDIFKEFSAQIEKVKSNGISITHLDTHHQIHDMWKIMQIILELLKTYRIPSMRILNNLYRSNYLYKNTYRKIVNYYLKSQKVNFTDFLGNQLDFLSLLKRNPAFLTGNNKSIEIMVHPELKENGLLIDKIADLEYDFQFQKIIRII